ncbi:MAG: ethylbenzene dehydrogenase-related protein [Candidatus Binatia bacterium]
MEAPYVTGQSVEALLDPEGPAWRGARAERLAMAGTPVGMQPTAAIRAAWATKPVGAVGAVEVRAVHDGTVLAFHLTWEDATENRVLGDTTAFPDAAAVVLPAAAGAPLITMGSATAPVNAWYWRADEPDGRGRHVVAAGLGSTRTLDTETVRGRGVWKDGRWQVVIARALRVATAETVAQLAAGTPASFAVAVWEGSHGERGGVKAFSGTWRELVLAPAAGR